MGVRVRHCRLYFRHSDHRQKTYENKEQRSENPDRADICPNVHPRRMINSPGRWQEIADQTAGNNDEALKPHARVHAHADEKDDKHIPAAPREPEKLRGKAIAEKHAKPPVPPVGTKDTVPKRETLV